MSQRRYFGPVALALATATVLMAACSADSPTAPQTASLSLTATPTIKLSPTSFTFYARRFYQSPIGKLSITNIGGGTLYWTASSNRSWLKISSAKGTAPSTVAVSVITTTYQGGLFRGLITIAATGASNSPQTVPVTLYLR